jgi:hypothetical protein
VLLVQLVRDDFRIFMGLLFLQKALRGCRELFAENAQVRFGGSAGAVDLFGELMVHCVQILEIQK